MGACKCVDVDIEGRGECDGVSVGMYEGGIKIWRICVWSVGVVLCWCGCDYNYI